MCSSSGDLLDGESDWAFKAALEYFNLSHDHSLAKVARQVHNSTALTEQWLAQYYLVPSSRRLLKRSM
jgi:hypothetical protein